MRDSDALTARLCSGHSTIGICPPRRTKPIRDHHTMSDIPGLARRSEFPEESRAARSRNHRTPDLTVWTTNGTLAYFGAGAIVCAFQIVGRSSDWVQGPALALSLAVAATAFYTIGPMRAAGAEAT